MVLIPVSFNPVTRLYLSTVLSEIFTENKLYGVAQNTFPSPAVRSMALLYGKCSLHCPMGGMGSCATEFNDIIMEKINTIFLTLQIYRNLINLKL